MSSILFRPEAKFDIEEVYQWYEKQRSGLGQAFIAALETTITYLQKNPEAYPIIYKGIRRALIRQFPYGIFYFIANETIVILGCFHFKRHPINWQDRTN